MGQGEKLFKDPVHGYISVPSDYCRDFIDTPIFQRLRHIEQTSMRPLYPAARHDRFIHSLGVYHLGRRVLDQLTQNTSDPELLGILRSDRLRQSFLVACLMHDCGHAPFSHTCEGFYNYSEAGTAQRAYTALAEAFPGQDFRVQDGFDPAPHEALSAVVLTRFYADALRPRQCDPELMARMITGCTYPSPTDVRQRVDNCLIGLLNGSAVDVDKLDYVLRDTWASGVRNTSVDVDRLICAVCLHAETAGKATTCFRQSALSVIQSVVDARNYLYEWVYNHHTVLYYSEMLRAAVRQLARHLAPERPDCFWEAMFSEKPFAAPVPLDHGVEVYLPTDGDILHLLKRFRHDAAIAQVDEYLSHSPRRVALWKTCAEFRMLFKGSQLLKADACRSAARRLPELIVTKLGCKADDVMVIPALSKHYFIEEGDIRILMSSTGTLQPFTEVVGTRGNQEEATRFFYVFIAPDYIGGRQDVIDLARGLTR